MRRRPGALLQQTPARKDGGRRGGPYLWHRCRQLRLSMGTLARRRALHQSGSGSAGGYGYHRPSAAVQEAATNAGFKFTRAFDGVGDSAVEEAVLAMAKALGHRKARLFVTHP